ncbi:uncharacterized protein HMPREF1541_09367 [Cyphellophora europaea CBS 101466]|uniref:E3 ubiquitin protein ligase n=1 Tax=Cyphellophora europaea (strain CBS 101466) TaxID=1220924 RepID=W2SA76_CYPE1|nr:uncharacterized protein HMPREF1541_09367 [Cyphellophora europaea CBS 101466]ETN45535.1 hypothetical protein HMPREF1541_09367 [Cyphellophora europaea CBS 101466]
MTAVDQIPLSLSQSSLVKMEDRKRSMPYDGSEAPPHKKQATTTNGAGKSHIDADMPWKDELERYQKDAIYRQMREYKRERDTLSSQLEDMRKRTQYHDEHIRSIDAWFKQLINEVKHMVPGDDDQDMDLASMPTSLLFEDQPRFANHISERSDDIRTMLSRLFSRSKSFTPEVLELQKQISKLLASEQAHFAEADRLRSDSENLEGRLETAIERYVVAEKKLDRAKSRAVAELEKQAILGPAKAADDTTTSKKEELTNGVSETSDDHAELEKEHKKALAVSETLKAQVDSIRQENSKLLAQVTEISAKTATMTDDDYAKTELFKQLKAQHDDGIKKLNDLEARMAQLKDENKKLSQERTSFQNKLDDESRIVIAEKDNQLGIIEKDLARIRAERDNLQADVSIKKATMDQEQEANRKIKELNAALEDRVKALESETERLSAQATMAIDDEQFDQMSAEDLRSKYLALDKNYKMLSGELTSMSMAFQRTSKIANQKIDEQRTLDEKVQRLSAEKAKADQKYFAAMKSKETRDQEIRTLKLQTSKSSEIFNQLKEADAASRTLLANLERQLGEMKEGHASKVSECRNAQQEKAVQDLEVSRLNKQVAELKQQLVAKDSENSKRATACNEIELEKTELTTTLGHCRKELEKWKSKSGHSAVYDDLHTMLFCHCKKNMKNAVIKTCGHVMCFDCINERVQSRSRKCPRCSKSFGSNDYMMVTL